MSTTKRLWIGLGALLAVSFAVLPFMGQPLIHPLVWMRVPGDTLFSVGALLLAWFVLCNLTRKTATEPQTN